MSHEPVSPRGRFDVLDHDPGYPPCVICGTPITIGHSPALVGPSIPASAEDAAKAAKGRAHTAQVSIAHETCAYQDGDL